MEEFKNLIEVTEYFADKVRAREYLVAKRWPNGVKCAHCGHDKVYPIASRHIYKCAKCEKQFSATKGTIFENSPISLQKWFVAIYLITAHKKGISSHQLGRDLSITQKSAWFVLHRVRYILKTGSFIHTVGATIEIDETYVGGESKNKHENKKIKNERGGTVSTKVPVMGILERGGRIKTIAITDTYKATLLSAIDENVAHGTKIMTDELPAYTSIATNYTHDTVHHRLKEFVRGDVHTNGVENYWSLFQRGIIGIYHHITPKHLDKYLNEFDFRFNTRKFTERDRFDSMLKRCQGRLTYAQLIDNGEDKSYFKFRPEAE